MNPISVIVIVVVVLFLGFNIYLRIKHKKKGISLSCEGCEHAGENCSKIGVCPAVRDALNDFKNDTKKNQE